MAQSSVAEGHETTFLSNHRTDKWWVGPMLTFLGFGAFIAYSTWAAFQGVHYYASPYLSPFYSPVIFLDPAAIGAAPAWHAVVDTWPKWWPAFLPHSPAFFILMFPGAFRFTCYYYRKAYYRSFPPYAPGGCSVTALPQKKYKGETRLLLFQNLHRYAMYFALIFIVILYYDAFLAFFKDGKFGIGVGSIVLLVNATLLAGYTFGCHSFRHMIGGKLDCFSCDTGCGIRHKLWSKATILNQKHMAWAWVSLFWVGFTDLYVRLVSMGKITDFNTWGN
jgi:hypothetical protein